ncbi:acyl-CoA synthetase FdrA [Microvirga sp. W0021]|uniref:Acyl-CoA synthetase FdrA n=1 Tax=Hohaiivirga grylli TaxID=3133970 RepID=A0ABV0BG18_9HYPH
MLFSVIKTGVFQDSVSLMLLTKKVSTLPGVDRLSVMMGTPANKEIFQNTGLSTPEVEAAKPSDLCVVVDAASADVVDEVMKGIEAFLSDQSVRRKGADYSQTKTLDGALSQIPDADIALISVAGRYAARLAGQALDRGLNVMMFSDNVSTEDEAALKKRAHEKGLLVMGPDCGTSMIGGQPLAFANVNKDGTIGLIGASGTGLQAVMAGIDFYDEGLSHAIGLGGRDLSSEIGGTSALDAIDFLARDPKTEVIGFISKPPAKAIRDKIVSALEAQPKPAVAIFLGEEGKADEGKGLTFAGTLDEAAFLAVQALKSVQASKCRAALTPQQRQIRGLYCGGTLASEAALLMGRGLNVPFTGAHDEGIMFSADGSTVIDLGDDVYTVGRAHPMIDPTLRGEMIVEAGKDSAVAVVLMDVVIGYGAHEDPAGQAAEMVEAARKARTCGGDVTYVAYVCGAKNDPQNLEAQKAKLIEAGVIVADSNREAVEFSLSIISEGKDLSSPANGKEAPKLLNHRPKVVNLGLRSFADDIHKSGGEVVHVNWAPPAGGDETLIAALDRLA